MTEAERPLDDERPFSAASRRAHWRALAGRRFDLLVIGGGITGVGIAHEAAGRGLDVALVERGDFAAGTSSRSSRLIHGGLRYLETFDFGLVFESLGERGHLLKLAPHLVHPLSFLFPVYTGAEVGMFKLRAGMWLYDALSLFRGLPPHRMLSRSGMLQHEPKLASRGLRGGALYYDAQVDDARLTLATARAAHEAGAVLVPYAAVTGFSLETGRIAAVQLTDRVTGEALQVEADLVLSATGPWTDETRRLADPDARPRLRPTKGVHLQFRRDRVGNSGAVIFQSSVDGRTMFVLPWGEHTYVGTTDTDFEASPGTVGAEPADIRYLLRSVNSLFPAARLTVEDVVSTWAGVRPLLAPDADEVEESETSREHAIWRDRNGLLCIAGGKLTTFRVMAEQAARMAASILRREHGTLSGHYDSSFLPLPGAYGMSGRAFQREMLERGRRAGVRPETARHLARTYGSDAARILREIERDPSLARPVLPDHPHVHAEVAHAVTHEMAMTLEDFLRRRVHLFYDAPDGALGAAREIAERMAALPGLEWGPAEIEAQVESYRAAVEKTRASLRE